MSESKPKILTLDIETKPAQVYTFQMFKANIGVDQIIAPGGTLCVGAKWHGESKVFFFSDWEHGHKGMLEGIHALMSEADAIISFNGDKFDLPKLNGEFLLNGLPPLPPISSIDLLKTVKYRFGFDMNRLAFVGPLLDVGKKMKHEGFDLWVKVMAGDPVAQRKMERYCKQDVLITDRLYTKIRGFITTHPALRSLGSEACPKCQSKNTQKRGKYITACYHYQRFQCQNCGGWFKGSGKKVA